MALLSRPRALVGTVATLALLGAGAPALSSPVPATSDDTRQESARHVYARLTDAARSPRVRVDLLAINDFHGNLEPITPLSSSGVINSTPAGGVAFLARHLKNLRAQARANGATPLTVAAGDLIGASPLLSAAFHDEPTIEAMNKLHLQAASVGNHEFDEGWRELRRLQRGGCLADGPDGENNQNSCPSHKFTGAEFQYLAANVKWDDGKTHKRPTILPAAKVMKVEGIKVGFIGMTLKDTPSIVTSSGVRGLKFTKEVRTANRLVPKLRKRGVEAIVVLLHQGADPADPTAYNLCSGVRGPGREIARNLSPAIDVVISGHTHQNYNCTVKDPAGHRRLFTSASSYGRMVTDVHLLLNPRTRDVVRPAAYAVNEIVTNNLGGADDDSKPDAHTRPIRALTRLITEYKLLVAPIASAVVGHLASVSLLSRTATPAGESPLGDLIADAQKADPTVIPPGGEAPQIAFMNPGGIRADLVENAAGDLTYEAAFTTQPFSNYQVSMDLTGQQILDLLEQQWSGANAGTEAKVLQVSGVNYTWDSSEPPGSRVVTGSVEVDSDADGTVDAALDPAATYRVVCNSFLSDGGDNFSVFADGTDKYFGGLDLDALVEYLGAHDPYTPVPSDRIEVQP